MFSPGAESLPRLLATLYNLGTMYVPMRQIQLHLVPFDTPVHDQVVSIHQSLGRQSPPFPEEAIVVAARDMSGEFPQDVYVASIYLFKATPFLMAEFGIVNPAAPIRIRHQAADAILKAYMARAAMLGMTPITHTGSKGIQAMLRRHGWLNSGRPMWVGSCPSVPIAPPSKVGKLKKPSTAERKDREDPTVEGSEPTDDKSVTNTTPKRKKRAKRRRKVAKKKGATTSKVPRES